MERLRATRNCLEHRAIIGGVMLSWSGLDMEIEKHSFERPTEDKTNKAC